MTAHAWSESGQPAVTHGNLRQATEGHANLKSFFTHPCAVCNVIGPEKRVRREMLQVEAHFHKMLRVENS